MRFIIILLTIISCTLFIDSTNALVNCTQYNNLKSCIKYKSDYCAYCYISNSCIPYDPCLGSSYKNICSNYTINPDLHKYLQGSNNQSCENYKYGWINSMFLLMYITAILIGTPCIFIGISILCNSGARFDPSENGPIDNTIDICPKMCGLIVILYGILQYIFPILCNIYYSKSDNVTDYNYYIATVMAITFWSSNVGLLLLLFFINCLGGIFCLIIGKSDEYCQFIRKWCRIIKWRCCKYCKCCGANDEFDSDQYFEI